MGFFHYALIWLVVTFIYVRVRNRAHARWYGRTAVIVIGAMLVLAPFVWLVPAVFKTTSAFTEYVFFPPPAKWSDTLTLDNFRKLFEGRPSLRGQVHFWEYFLNSTVVATVTTTLQIVFSSLAGYALAKFNFRGKTGLTLFMLGSMMVPSVLLQAPLYKMVVDLGLVDTLPGLIIPTATAMRKSRSPSQPYCWTTPCCRKGTITRPLPKVRAPALRKNRRSLVSVEALATVAALTGV